MIDSRKHRILTVLLLTGLCTTTFAAEPNPPKPELKFDIVTKKPKWVGQNDGPFCKGPIKPKCAAIFGIKGDCYLWRLSNSEIKEVLLKTSAGESMSAEQKEFMTKSKDVTYLSQVRSAKYPIYYSLYAVSQDDAKKMAAALIEALNDPQTRIRLYKRGVSILEDQLLDMQSGLANQDTRMEMSLAKFREEKLKKLPYLTVEEAKITILEVNKMLNRLYIDRAGVRAQLEAVELQRAIQEKDKKVEEEKSRKGILLKLEEMKVDLAIEHAALESKIGTASNLRDLAKHFYKRMRDKQLELKEMATHFIREIEETERELRRIEKILANPKSKIPPVRVNKNTVTIYPVGEPEKTKQ